MVGRGAERTQTGERQLRVFDNPLQAAEYRFIHSLLNKPQIKALQLKGGTDISLFKGLPQDDIYWVEDDPRRADLVKSTLSSGEQARIKPGPSKSYKHDSPVDMLALRSAHLDRGEEQELYKNVDANIRPGGYLVTSHHKHQRDAAHFVADPGYELVGVLTNIGTKDEPKIEFVPEHNEEYIDRLKLFGKRNDDPTKDEYSGTTFLFKKKEAVVSPPQPVAAPPPPSESPQRESPAPQVPVQHEPEPVQPVPQQPVVTHPTPTTEHKPAAAVVTTVAKAPEKPKVEKKETFKTVTETSRKWMKAKLKSVQKVLADLGMTVAGEVWTTLATLISVGTISLYFITGGAFSPIPPLVGAIIPSAIGALVNYPGIKGSKSDAEKVSWWGSHIAASAGIFSPISNVLSAVTKFLGRTKNVAH